MTTTDLSTHLGCACPCGCQKPTDLLDTGSRVLARHARCPACATPAHAAAHAPAPVQGETGHGRATTEVYTPDPEERAAALEAQKRTQDEIWQAAWDRWVLLLPEKFQAAETHHPLVLERLGRLADGKRAVAGLAVFGSVGAGKTWVAVAYANQAIKAGFFKPSEVLFGSEAELLASPVNGAFNEVEPALRRLTSSRYKMLVIDDVGRGTWLREDMRSKVFSLVLDKMWADNRVVVITTNLRPEVLAEYVGEGAMDRLRAMTGYGGLVLDSEHKRRQITEEMLARGVDPTEPHPGHGATETNSR